MQLSYLAEDGGAVIDMVLDVSPGTERYPLQRRLPGTNTDTAEYTGKSR